MLIGKPFAGIIISWYPCESEIITGHAWLPTLLVALTIDKVLKLRVLRKVRGFPDPFHLELLIFKGARTEVLRAAELCDN